MDRNREARRGSIVSTANGLSRRRQRSSGSSFRDSPEEDGAVELHETVTLRDRSGKKDRDRDRDRDRDQERDRERGRDGDRERLNRAKRPRRERLLHGGNREDGGDESTEESVNDDDEEAPMMAFQLQLPVNHTPPVASPAASASASLPATNHFKKSLPAKIGRPATPMKAADEIICASAVPRKARSGRDASAKRSHEFWSSGVVGGGSNSNGGEPTLRQASSSPARPSSGAPAPPAMSTSPSNPSLRKKMKPIGTKHKPPKVSKTSSAQESEIEIEIAEVLYGMTRQLPCPSKQDTATAASASMTGKLNLRDANGMGNVVKSRGSSPIGISPAADAGTQSSIPMQTSNSMASAPKRKRPRPLQLEEDESLPELSAPDVAVSSPASAAAAAKVQIQQPDQSEVSLPRTDNPSHTADADEKGPKSAEPGSSQIASVLPELPKVAVKMEINEATVPVAPKSDQEGQDRLKAKDEILSPVESSPRAKIVLDLGDANTTSKLEATSPAVKGPREEKFKIDLMAPPSGKSSPERDDNTDSAMEQKPEDLELAPKKEAVEEEGDRAQGIVEGAGDVYVSREKKQETSAEELGSQKQNGKEKPLGLQIDDEKLNEDRKNAQQMKPSRNEFKAEKTAQPGSFPLPVTGWPSSIPPLGYTGQIPQPLPVVTMDAAPTSSATPPNLIVPIPRPRRCATHCYIAQSINYHLQFRKMNPFCWDATACSAASLMGSKHCNLNAVPPAESPGGGNPLQGSFNGGNAQYKGSGAGSAGHNAKDKNTAAMFVDSAQRKQLLLQQASPHATPFIFPFNQQQPGVTTRSGASKSVTNPSNAASSSSAADIIVGSGPSSSLTAAPAVSFNYANLPATEAQYLAMLQSNGYPFNGYPFPLPAHVGVPPPFSGSHHHPALPFFNGSFYSPQMPHPSQLQQQHPQSQSPAVQPGSQKTSTSNGSSSSQKHQQQQRMQGCVGSGGGGVPQGFPTLKHSQQPPHLSRQHDTDVRNDDSPSTADSRALQAQKTVFTHNFAMPVLSQNFTIMTPATAGSGNQGEKQQNQQSSKGVEINQSQAFAMSFASFNGGATTAPVPCLDFSSMSQNHAVFQSLPESSRHWYQLAASAASSQTTQLKNHLAAEERKPVAESFASNTGGEDERKVAGKVPPNISSSLTFSRHDKDSSSSPVLSNGMVDSSSRPLSVLPALGTGSRAASHTGPVAIVTTAGATAVSYTPDSSYHHHQLNSLQHHNQQLIQLQKQQLTACMKSASTNANVYSDRLPFAMAKFPNAVPVFPQASAPSSNLPSSAQWKASAKTGTTPIPVPSQAPASSTKSLPQQHSRTQLGVPNSSHTQISFGVSTTKSSSSGQQFPSSSLSPSAGSVVGSPPTSMSRSAGGSPKTTTGAKSGPMDLPPSSQPAKNTPPSSSRKSSPVSSQHAPSILNNSNVSSTQSSAVKPQQQQQQLLPKQAFPQAQAFFSNMYVQPQPSLTTSNTSSPYRQKRQSELQQSSSAVSSSGMLSLCSPATFPGPITSDPAKAVAAAANTMKGMPPQGFLQAAQFAAQPTGNPHLLMSANIPYIQSVAAMPAKSTERKPAAGREKMT